MLREVTIEEYWPLIVKNTAEFQQIAVAENPEFNKLAECIYRVLEDGFIADATEYGVERWEKILGISPADGATLDDRKAAVLTHLNVKLPYTWRVLKQMLVPILGGEDKFVMEYVNDEGKLVLHTDRLNDTMLATVSDLLERVLPQNIEVVRYNHHIEVSWRDLNKYAECVTLSDIKAVNPDYQNDLTSDGSWIYPLPVYANASVFADDSYGIFSSSKAAIQPVYLYYYTEVTNMQSHLARGNKKLKKVIIESPNLNSIRYSFNGCVNLEEAEFYMPKLQGVLNAFAGCINLRRFNLVLPLGTACDHGGEAENAAGLCLSSQIDAESAIRLLDSLPERNSYKIGLGIHVDLQTDEDVLAAIAGAEGKGWIVTIRWNGTPTSGISTLDLEEIYAKVTILDDEQAQYGEYTNENGNRCTLDWGHYVTDTTDYKLFFSLVEAEQYFKLTRIENNE